MQLYLHLLKHFSLYSLFHLVHGEVYSEASASGLTLYTEFCSPGNVIFPALQVATRNTSPDMTTVFHARLNSRFIKI